MAAKAEGSIRAQLLQYPVAAAAAAVPAAAVPAACQSQGAKLEGLDIMLHTNNLKAALLFWLCFIIAGLKLLGVVRKLAQAQWGHSPSVSVCLFGTPFIYHHAAHALSLSVVFPSLPL